MVDSDNQLIAMIFVNWSIFGQLVWELYEWFPIISEEFPRKTTTADLSLADQHLLACDMITLWWGKSLYFSEIYIIIDFWYLQRGIVVCSPTSFSLTWKCTKILRFLFSFFTLFFTGAQAIKSSFVGLLFAVFSFSWFHLIWTRRADVCI